MAYKDMYYVYVLKSLKDYSFYIGCTSDLQKRLIAHNAGKTFSLKNRRPLVVVYSERYNSWSEAYDREKQMKSYKGGKAFKKLLKTGGVA